MNMEKRPHYTHDLWGNALASDNSRRSHVKEAPALEGTVLAPNTTKLLRERLQQRGVSSLSNPELLSLVFRTGQAKETIVPRVSSLLTNYSLQQLLSADFGQLAAEHGLGEAKAAQLQATLEVARRLLLPSTEEKYCIRSAFDAVQLVRPEMEHLDHEEVRILLLDVKNQVTANLSLYQGTMNSAVLRVGEIFRPAVARKNASIILFHNHPSGDPTPSPEDIDMTQKVQEAGKVLEIELLDHIIIGKNNRFVSLKERMRW